MSSKRKFFLIDDDAINNLISRISLKKSLGEVQVLDFEDGEVGLEYIANKFTFKTNEKKAVLFLDINMPTLSGWEFLEKFNKLDISIKKQIDIYILSSSVDNRDLKKANDHPLVKSFIEKPLKKQLLVSLFGDPELVAV